MKRQLKKALSIVVASSVALSMPVTTMAEDAMAQDTTDEQSEEIKTVLDERGGIHVNDGQTVNITGDVVTKNWEGIDARDQSYVTVNGNVTSSGEVQAIWNTASNVKVTGNVTATKYGSDTGGGKTQIGGNVISDAYGVQTSSNATFGESPGGDASTIVNGSVTAKWTGVIVSTGGHDCSKQMSFARVDKGVAVAGGREHDSETEDGYTTDLDAIGASIRNWHKSGEAELQVNGGIHTMTDNYTDEPTIDRASSIGLDITNISGEASAKIDGGIKSESFAGSKNYATGIYITEDDYDDENTVDKMPKTDVTVKDGITAKSNFIAMGIEFDGLHGTTNVNVDGDVCADANEVANGIVLSAEDERSKANIIVNGDVKGSTSGISFDGFDGTANVIVNGTVSGGKSAVIINKTTETYPDDGDENNENDAENKVVTEKHGYNGSSNITVWKMTSEDKDLVQVEERDYTQGKDECKVDTEAADKVMKNINYIIRTDKVSNGTIHLSNTRLISGFDTARETEDITIKVEASDGYKVDSVKNGDAVLTKNADGTYTLTVPRGGGVQLSAVLSAIQKSQSSLSESSGSSSSSHSESSSVDTQTSSSSSGATVATTVSDSNGTHNTNAVVKIANKQATVSTSEQTGNGNSIVIRNVSGDITGATFTGAGTVSSDGKSIATTDGQVHAVTQAPMLVIKTGDQSVGCFVDLTTGAPLATGKTEVYYQLAADGQMYAHWVNPLGFFYTGTVVMNGKTITFNEQGVMIDIR